MKKYDLHKIMKQAHETYNSKRFRMGRTFGECLKAAWRCEKDAVKFREEREAKMKAMAAMQKPVQGTSYNSLTMTWQDCYNANSRGYMGAQYCGD